MNETEFIEEHGEEAWEVRRREKGIISIVFHLEEYHKLIDYLDIVKFRRPPLSGSEKGQVGITDDPIS